MGTPEIKKVEVTLTAGGKVTLRPLSVWDSVKFRERFGKNLEAISPPSGEIPPEGTPERDEFDNFQRMASLYLVYRSAVRGGFGGTEEEFWSDVPLFDDDLGRLMEAAVGFFGAGRGSGSSPDSSGQDSESGS